MAKSKKFRPPLPTLAELRAAKVRVPLQGTEKFNAFIDVAMVGNLTKTVERSIFNARGTVIKIEKTTVDVPVSSVYDRKQVYMHFAGISKSLYKDAGKAGACKTNAFHKVKPGKVYREMGKGKGRGSIGLGRTQVPGSYANRTAL